MLSKTSAMNKRIKVESLQSLFSMKNSIYSMIVDVKVDKGEDQ